MINEPGFVPFTGSPESLFPAGQQYVFLVGAGISMDPPSSLPSARMFVRELLEVFAPHEEVERFLSIENLRYEHVVEMVEQMFDRDLKFFDYFSEVTEPNLLHLFLAEAIIGGHFVVTTNFDYLIEQSLLRLLPESRRDDVYLIINQSDYKNDPQDLVKARKILLVKIHGSKLNIINGKNCSPSLITTASALGAKKGVGETFGLEPFKKPTIDAIMKGRKLIVMGYSGSDDFDIGPLLKGLQGISHIIWIEHTVRSSSPAAIREVVPIADPGTTRFASRTDAVLVDILASNPSLKIHQVRANTGDFIRLVVKPSLFPRGEGIVQDKLSAGGSTTAPPFREFIAPLYRNIPAAKKYMAVCGIYARFGMDEDCLRCAQKGLAIATAGNSTEEQGYFLNFIAGMFQSARKLDQALQFYQEALSICDELKKVDAKKSMHMKEALLSNIGTLYKTQGDMASALKYFEEAVKIGIESGSVFFYPDSVVNLATMYVANGDLQKAAQYLDKALEIAMISGNLLNKSRILITYGEIHQKRGDTDQATKTFQEALDINDKMGFLPDKLAVLYKMGLFFKDINRYDDAIARFREAIPIAEKLGNMVSKSRIIEKIGRVLLLKKDNDAAERSFRDAIEANSRNDVAWYSLGDYYYDRDNFHEAESCYRKAIELSPKEIGYYNDLAIACLKQGRAVEAKSIIEKARAADPNNPYFVFTAARIMAILGEIDSSLALLRQAITKDPSLAATARVSKELASLRDDARFKALVK